MHASTCLPAAPTTPGVARRWAVELCRTQHLDEWVDVVALVVTELVTNAVVHGRSEVTIDLTTPPAEGPGLVRVAVSDRDSRLPRSESVGDGALGGRGLRIVDALSLGWGVDVDEDGKTVWTEIALVRDEEGATSPSHDLEAQAG